MRNRPTPFALLVGITALLSLAIPRALDARAASLVCKFVDEQGKPLRNVETQLTPVGTQELLFQKSDKNGQLSFRSLKAGPYELRAQLKDHVPVKLTVTITDDRTLALELMTRKAFDARDHEAAQAINARDFSKAAAVLEKLLIAYPEDPVLHDNLGRSYAGMLEQDKALAEAERAAQLDPQFNDSKRQIELFILRERGQRALQDRKFPVAAEFFDKWIQLDPKSAEAYYGLALAYGHEEKFKQALAAINRALELDPQNSSYLKVKEVLETNAGTK